MSIGEVDDIRSRTALPMSKADTVLEDHKGGVVLSQVLVHFQGADLVRRLVKHQLLETTANTNLSVHLIELLGPIPKSLVLKVGMVGQSPPSAELHTS